MQLIMLPNRLIRPVSRITTRRILPCCAPRASQQRHASSDADPIDRKAMNPILQEYYAKRPAKLQSAMTGKKGAPKIEFGSMPKRTIFRDEDKEATAVEEAEDKEVTASEEETQVALSDSVDAGFREMRSLDALNVVLDPYPHKRWQWERERIIKDVRRGWRLTKAEYLQRTERRSALNSAPLKTSRKKLALLAAQISGKSIDEALLQLRFSKKRTANEIIKHVELARDHAVVRWGMGLGEVEGRKGEPITITLNNGKRRQITDRTSIYIEHAMVRSRKPELQPEYRARGKMNILRKPFTTLRLVLREEHTRIRECQERAERKLRRKPFEPLADKPITQQRQYVLW